MPSDFTDAGSVKQGYDSFLPFDDASDSLQYCDDEINSSATLFSSPSVVSVDDDKGSNDIKNIIGMLMDAETSSSGQGANGKMMVDETKETSATWDLDDLDDVDEWLRDQQCDVGPVSSFTELHQPSISTEVSLCGSPTGSIQPPAAKTVSTCANSENGISCKSSHHYFTQSELVSSCIGLHQPSVSQPPLLPLHGSLAGSVQPQAITGSDAASSQNSMFFTPGPASSLTEPHQSASQLLYGSPAGDVHPLAVTSSGFAGCQNNMSFTSNCQHCNFGICSLSSFV